MYFTTFKKGALPGWCMDILTRTDAACSISLSVLVEEGRWHVASTLAHPFPSGNYMQGVDHVQLQEALYMLHVLKGKDAVHIFAQMWMCPENRL